MTKPKRIRPVNVERTQSHGGLRILSIKLGEPPSADARNRKHGAAAAVWESLSVEQLQYDLLGEKTPVKRQYIPHAEIKKVLHSGMLAGCWLMPEADTELARRRGLIDCDFQEYLERVERFIRQCEDAGAYPAIVECSVSFLLAAMQARNRNKVDEVILELMTESM